MRTYTSVLAGILLFLILGFLGGCSQSAIGLFESIELERKIIDDRELGNDLLVGAIARSADRYFIAAATLWYRVVDDPDYTSGDIAQWVAVPSPISASATNFTTSSLTTFAGSGAELLYAAYSSQDGTEGGVYAIDPVGTLASVPADANIFNFQALGLAGVGKVFAANDGISDQLLVAVRKVATSRYGLYTSSTGAEGSFAEVDGSDNSLPVIDVAYSAAGEVAILTQKALLIDVDGLSTDGSGAAPVDITSALAIVDRQPEFGGIYYSEASSTLWLTDNEGFLYHSPDFGTTWLVNTVAHPGTGDDPLEFTDIVSLDNGGSELLLVGTSGSGYRELDASLSPTIPAAEGSNYQASELARATILAFYVDPAVTGYIPSETGETYEEATGDRLFAGTSNLGLWKVLYTGAAPQWVRE